MTGCINARSVIKTVTTTYARALRDSDAFILPDYIHGCAFRSHHGHTHGSISARSPLGRGLFFFWPSLKPVEKAFCDWLIYFIFFNPGGLGNAPTDTGTVLNCDLAQLFKIFASPSPP